VFEVLEPLLPPRRPIAIIRLDDLSGSERILAALREGGITLVEFALTSPGALGALAAASRDFGSAMTLGAGTVLTPEDARACIEAGARFLVTPAFVPDVIFEANAAGVPIVCGAYTPTEMLEAHRAGADYIKLFPATRVGPGYVQDVLAPLPFLKIVPTGGVTPENTADFLRAGAYSVAVSSSLVSRKAVSEGDWTEITRVARLFMAACESVDGAG
jgi:2-dehydro-3-deoxyphosphogluconate aldolase/(4S)-4-hydroxy-2-oxoglutarate aldolase